MSEKNIKKLAVSSAIGGGIGIISSAMLIFMMAAVLTVGNIPAMIISPATVLLLLFGSFAGGFCGARISGKNGILCGAFSGIIFFTVIWISGGIMEIGGFGIPAFTKAATVIISASLGGIIGVNYVKRK